MGHVGEVGDSFPQQHRDKADAHLVDQAQIQGLGGDTGAGDGDVLVPGDMPGGGNSARHAAGEADGRPFAGVPAGPQAGPGRIVRLGQRIMGGGADASGEIYLSSYARTASGPQFSVFARTRHWSGAWEPSGPRFFDRFIATDDRDQLPDNHP